MGYKVHKSGLIMACICTVLENYTVGFKLLIFRTWLKFGLPQVTEIILDTLMDNLSFSDMHAIRILSSNVDALVFKGGLISECLNLFYQLKQCAKSLLSTFQPKVNKNLLLIWHMFEERTNFSKIKPHLKTF